MCFKQCSLSYLLQKVSSSIHVGSATTEFKVRFCNHKSAMRANKKKHVNWLLITIETSPHVKQDFTFQCIDKVDPKTDPERIENILTTKEAYWMTQLFCIFPNGLNKRLGIHSNKRIIMVNRSHLMAFQLVIHCLLSV